MKNKIVSLFMVAVFVLGTPISVSVSYAEEETAIQNNLEEISLTNEQNAELNADDEEQIDKSDNSDNTNDNMSDISTEDDNSTSDENGNNLETNVDLDNNATQKSDIELDLDANNAELEDNSNDTDLSNDDLSDETDVVIPEEELTVEKAGAAANSREMSTSTEDITSPTLVSITLDKTTIEAPGVINITVVAKDEVSGIDYAIVSFRNLVTDTRIRTTLYADEDGKMQEKIEIPQYAGNGEYVIDEINIYDVAGNYTWLIGVANTFYGQLENNLPEELINLSFTVKNETSDDITSPTLVGIALDKTKVEAPNTIYVTIEAKDDVSGLNYANINFKNEQTGKTVGTYLKADDNGKLSGEIEISQYTGNGEYIIDEVNITDIAGNNTWLIGRANTFYGTLKNELPESLISLAFTVGNEASEDITSPELLNIILDKTTAEAPGIIGITIDAKDDLSGLDYAIIYFKNDRTDKRISVTASSYYTDEEYKKHIYEDGKLHGEIEISQYTGIGEYLIDEVYLYDMAHNSTWLIGYVNTFYGTLNNILPESMLDISITVIDNNKQSNTDNNVIYSSDIHDENGNEVEESTYENSKYNYTPEELTRRSYVGREKISAVLGMENKYGIMIQNSIQGPKCIDVFNFVKGEYIIGRTYNIFPTNEFGIHSKESTAKITLTIPKAIYNANRTYEMICVGANGMPYILEDQDTNPETITFETNNFYAFALCYKEIDN